MASMAILNSIKNIPFVGSRIKGDAGRMCFWIFKVKLASPVSPLFQKSTKLRFGKISSSDNLLTVTT